MSDDFDKRKNELAWLLGLEAKKGRLAAIEQLMTQTDFWSDHHRSAKASQELSHLQAIIGRFEAAKTDQDLDLLTDETLFSDPHDNSNCFLAVHAGAGGTEAQDWARMLLRMYQRFAERRGYQTTLLDQTEGEEAGIKSASLAILGWRSYGYLKGESGVHRLVRISPFDADKARHTSFALVEVVPEVSASELVIAPQELKIDVFRSGGAGGQSVNTTDSAVRITHLPTGLVVTCQNERSQVQNKAQALKILKGKLELLADEKRRIEQMNLKGEPVLASWGNQIRSYVLAPYQLVKDLRSGWESAQVKQILDGELDELMESGLMMAKRPRLG